VNVYYCGELTLGIRKVVITKLFENLLYFQHVGSQILQLDWLWFRILNEICIIEFVSSWERESGFNYDFRKMKREGFGICLPEFEIDYVLNFFEHLFHQERESMLLNFQITKGNAPHL
jgi:hypothetical protein